MSSFSFLVKGLIPRASRNSLFLLSSFILAAVWARIARLSAFISVGGYFLVFLLRGFRIMFRSFFLRVFIILSYGFFLGFPFFPILGRARPLPKGEPPGPLPPRAYPPPYDDTIGPFPRQHESGQVVGPADGPADLGGRPKHSAK